MSLQGIEVVDQYLKDLRVSVQGMLDSIMAESLLTIVSLVNSGKNVFEQPFIPYSKTYRLQRQKQGLRVTPNMQNTSSMINSLHVSKSGKYTRTIGVSGSDRHGVSNSVKIRELEKMKNYQILFWSDRLKKIADKYMKKMTV